MKNFIRLMLSESDGSPSSKRVSGFLCLLFFFAISLINTLTHFTVPEVLYTDTMILIGGFFTMTTITSVAQINADVKTGAPAETK